MFLESHLARGFCALHTTPLRCSETQRQRLARPSPLRQPLSGHPGRVRVRYLAAKEEDIVPGQGAFRTRDELVQGSFSTAQAESLTKLFPAGSALAKVFETMEKTQKEREEAQEQKEKEREEKEKEKKREEKEKEREEKEKMREKELKQRLDILSLGLGLLVLLLLAQHDGIAGVLNTVFKAVLRI